MFRRYVAPAFLALTAAILVVAVPVSTAPLHSPTFLETFSGTPGSPAAWHPTDWAVDANNSDAWNSSTPLSMDGMAAHHGTDCSAHPATHAVSNLTDAVFKCNDHVMTSITGGYAAAYLTPPALVDFSDGTAVVSFDMTTHRTVGRDWVDLWLTPFGSQFALPLNLWLPPYQGEPEYAVQVKMEGASRFEAYDFRPGSRSTAAQLPVADFDPYETWLTPSATTRETFELHISRTHIKFGMPDYNQWWVDTDFDSPLDFDTAVLQLGHHAYNPEKDCSSNCENSWHWDNVSIDPYLPMTVVPASPRTAWVKKDVQDTITFQAPAPAGSSLRFAAVGANFELSFNGGSTWSSVSHQPADRYAPEHFSSYLYSTVPTGATSVKVRATGHSYIGVWFASHFNLMAPGAAGPTATPTDTPTPGPTLTPSHTPTVTPTPTATRTPTPSPTPNTSDVTITFDTNPPWSGTGAFSGTRDGVNWGTNQWYLSGPYAGFTSKSASFNGGGSTSKLLTLPAGRHLVSFKASNAGGGASTVTANCSGQTPVSASVPANSSVVTINTGWTADCAAVTIGSSNGWDTNFDDLVLRD
jgi:hypothetical protein